MPNSAFAPFAGSTTPSVYSTSVSPGASVVASRPRSSPPARRPSAEPPQRKSRARSRGAQQQRRVVAAVDVAQLAARGVEHAADGGHEARGVAELEHRLVEPRRHGAQVRLALHLGAQRRAERRHDQRRGDALARDVGHDDPDAIRAERHVVVVVAADRVRRQVDRGDVVAREARRRPGSRPVCTSRATLSWSSMRCFSSTCRCSSAFSIVSAAALAKNCRSSASSAVKAASRSLSTLRQPTTPVSLTIGTASSESVVRAARDVARVAAHVGRQHASRPCGSRGR